MPRLKDNRPIDRDRYVGRWAMTFNHFLFRIEAVQENGRDIAYQGTGLRGQRITTHYPVEILRAEDEEWINAKVGAE